ncbi:MAG: hypothetical protein ACRDPD_06405 [Streptosporangiaceae bacterium]
MAARLAMRGGGTHHGQCVQRMRRRVDVGWSGGHRELLLTGDGRAGFMSMVGTAGVPLTGEHAPLYGQRQQMWQVRFGCGEFVADGVAA